MAPQSSTTPMILGYLTSRYGRAADTFMRREVEQLRRFGHLVHTFSIRKPDPQEIVGESVREEHLRTEFVLERGVGRLAIAALRAALVAPRRFLRAVRMVMRTVPPTTERHWIRRLAYLLEAAYLAERLAAKHVQHLHNHIGENSAVVAMLAATLTGLPYSLTIHGSSEFDRAPFLALDVKIHHAAFVAAISHFTRSQLCRWAPFEDWPKIHVIRCALDPTGAAVEPVPSRAALVTVGRLAEAKGQWLLLDAAALVRDRGFDFELVIVGDGPLREALERRIVELDLGRQVWITGLVANDQAMRYMRSARALVLPSFAEGLPGVIIEAFALGRPVISTYIAGTPELVQNGVSGWLIPAGTAELLADAMTEALSADPHDLDRMGRAGAARVAELHDAAVEGRKLEALFRQRGHPATISPSVAPAGAVSKL